MPQSCKSVQARYLIANARSYLRCAEQLGQGGLALIYRNRAAEALRAARNVLAGAS